MQRRLIGLAGAVLAGVLMLTACGDDAVSGPTTLKLVAADYGSSASTSSKKYWNRVAREFSQQNPDITVDVNVISWNDIDAKVSEMIERGDYPDIVQTGGYASYAADDALYSADELLSIPVQADFLTTMADAGQVRRVQYGLPFVSSSRMLFYNKKLFAQAGITTGPPETWKELKAIAQKLKNVGVEVPYGLPLGPEEAQAESMMWMLGASGGFTDQVGTYTLDSRENVETFGWLKDNLVEPGLVGPDPVTTNRQVVFDKFLQGKVGMLNGHPTLTGQAKQAGIDYGLAPIPGRDEALEETLGVADWVMAFKKNGRRDAIGAFLSYAYNEKNTVDFLKQYDLLPVTSSALDRMLEDTSRQDIWPFLDKLPSAQFYPLGDEEWGAVNAQIKKEIGKAVKQEPVAVLRRLQKFAQRESALAEEQ